MAKEIQTDDDKIMKMMEVVKQRKAEIAKISRPTWLTSCTIGYNPESVADRVNIQTVTKPERLIELYSFLLVKEQTWMESVTALDFLGEPVSKPTYMGYSVADWKTDLRARAAQLTIEKKKKELEKLEQRLDSIVSPEQRRKLEMAAIERELGAAGT